MRSIPGQTARSGRLNGFYHPFSHQPKRRISLPYPQVYLKGTALVSHHLKILALCPISFQVPQNWACVNIFGLRVIRRPPFPHLNATYRSHIHIKAVRARRWFAIHSQPQPEPNFMVTHAEVLPRVAVRPSGSCTIPFLNPSSLP